MIYFVRRQPFRREPGHTRYERTPAYNNNYPYRYYYTILDTRSPRGIRNPYAGVHLCKNTGNLNVRLYMYVYIRRLRGSELEGEGRGRAIMYINDTPAVNMVCNMYS